MHAILCRWLCLGCSFVVLAGCEATLLSSSGDKPPLICPRADVVEQAASYTNFASSRVGDVEAARYSLNFSAQSGECALDDKGNLRIDQYSIFLAYPEIALEGNTRTDADWFIVLLREADDRQEILARQIFTHAVNVQKDGDPVLFREHFVFNIPNQTPDTMRSLRIVSGFVLKDEEWDFNEAKPFFFR